MKRFVSIILSFILSIPLIYSQGIGNRAMNWDEFVTLMADESDDDYEPDSELFEELNELHNNPMNLNTVTSEDLHKLPFLSEDDIKNILYYVDNHRPLFSTGELMFIYSLDRQKRMMLQLFCYAGQTKEKQPSLKNIFKYARHELTLRTDIPLYTKEGYKNLSDSILSKNPNKVYKGNKLYHSIRYNVSSYEHFFAGIQMEKDAGEKYVDHFAGYLMLKDIGKLRSAILGNYKISFGHGLVVNTGSVFGKTMKLSSMDIIDKGISKQSSTAESGYFTGCAAAFRFGNMQATAFCSYQKTDGTYNSDSTGLTALKTDGLHRTQLELSKKNNIQKSDFGANVHFDFNKLQLSATVAYTHLNAPLKPKYNTESSAYRYYNPQGDNFIAYSIAYSYRMNHLLFSGETAMNSSGGIATLNQLQWQPNSFNTFTLIQRQYGAKYYALNARAFGENSNVQNERGLYLGWNSSSLKKLNINAYFDAIYFPWIKYQVSNSSYSFEGLIQGVYTFSESSSLSLRYRIKAKQIDNDNKSALTYKTNQNVRLLYNVSPTEKISLRTTLSATLNRLESKTSKGYSIGQSVRYNALNKVRIDLSTIYFNTDSYETRIYNYESSLLYSFAMNSYFYKGIRTTLLSSWKITNKITLTAKFGTTIYFNKDSFGSGLELINQKHKEDIQLQLHCKL